MVKGQPGIPRRFLVTVTNAVTVQADSPAEAELLGLDLLDGGFGDAFFVEVEPLGRMSAND